MRKVCATLVIFLIAGLGAFAQSRPQTLETVPLFPGATRNSTAEVEYNDDFSTDRTVRVFTVNQAPEEVLAWYIKTLGSQSMDGMQGPPQIKVGMVSDSFHMINYLDEDSLEDGYADDRKTYEAKWIKDQLKANRKKSGEGYVDNAQFFWAYRKASSVYHQFEMNIIDRTFTEYTTGNNATGALPGKKIYRAQTDIVVVEQISKGN